MLDFSPWIDLPLIWSGIIAIAVLLYVLLDGFDLGCGIIFPFAPSDDCRSRIMIVKCNQLLTHYCNQLLTHLRPIKS
jgi:cytochrome bd-type quinol oxidase subunit 2